MAEQSFKSHTRIVPAFHGGVLVPLAANFFWSIYRLTQGFSGETVMQFVVAVALVLLAFSVRGMVLTVQDRVIRLEMRLRLASLLPAAQQASINQLSPKQLVALRFASDAELPVFVQQVVGGQLTTGRAIKEQIKHWQADNLRA